MISRPTSYTGGSLSPESILPHYLELHTPKNDGAFSDTTLKVGEVVEVILPSSASSLSKLFVEYRVQAQYLDPETRTGTSREYSNCVLINPLAGLADRSFMQLRADNKRDSEGLGMGSKVLLLCVNSEHNQAIILGGLRDEKDSGDQNFLDNNIVFQSELNGVILSINAKGEITLSRTGPTGIDGKHTNTEKKSTLSFSSNGSVTANTDNQTIAINQPNKTVELKADNGIKVGRATNKFPLFSDYRRSESSMHNTMVNILTFLSTLNETMATQLKTASGLIAVPVVGGTLAAPSFAAISVQLTGVTQLIKLTIQAIRVFENGSYLSSNNEND